MNHLYTEKQECNATGEMLRNAGCSSIGKQVAECEAGYGSDEPSRPSVFDRTDAIEKRIAVMRGVVEQFRKRLAPVVRPQGTAGLKGVNTKSAGSPLSEKLRSIESGMQVLVNDLSELLDSVEL